MKGGHAAGHCQLLKVTDIASTLILFSTPPMLQNLLISLPLYAMPYNCKWSQFPCTSFHKEVGSVSPFFGSGLSSAIFNVVGVRLLCKL